MLPCVIVHFRPGRSIRVAFEAYATWQDGSGSDVFLIHENSAKTNCITGCQTGCPCLWTVIYKQCTPPHTSVQDQHIHGCADEFSELCYSHSVDIWHDYCHCFGWNLGFSPGDACKAGDASLGKPLIAHFMLFSDKNDHQILASVQNVAVVVVIKWLKSQNVIRIYWAYPAVWALLCPPVQDVRHHSTEPPWTKPFQHQIFKSYTLCKKECINK